MKRFLYINERSIKRKSQVTKFKYINEAISIFEQLIEDYGSHITNTKVIPCVIEEVNALESKLSPPFRLPTAYKKFLLYGGKKMAGLSGVLDISYGMARICLEDPNEVYDLFCDEELEGKVPPEMFFLTQRLAGHVSYFMLNEGDNLPVYTWNEEDGDGLDTVKKSYSSFSEFLKSLVITKLSYVRIEAIDENLNSDNPPRGKQFWIAKTTELVQGVNKERLSRALDFAQYRYLEKAAHLSKLDPYSYLKELSGWKARKIGDEIRFFPPSNVAK